MSATTPSAAWTTKLALVAPAGITTSSVSLPIVLAFGANCTSPIESAVMVMVVPPTGAGEPGVETVRARCSPEPR